MLKKGPWLSMETTEMGVLLWESREREVAPNMSQMWVSAECLTGRTHLPPRCVPSTVSPGLVPGVSFGLFYSRVDFHFHFIDEETETQRQVTDPEQAGSDR